MYITILITPFHPFPPQPLNPPLQPLKLLPHQIPPHNIHNLQIPTLFHKTKHLILS
ncbi:pyroglutamyl-peptidase I family protein, partial [Staphylococcus saprophyticus]